MKDKVIAVLFAVAAVGSAAGVPCGNVAFREVVRGPDAQAVSITTNAAGHAVLDFGKHQVGWLEVDVKKPGPYKIVLGVVHRAFYLDEYEPWHEVTPPLPLHQWGLTL